MLMMTSFLQIINDTPNGVSQFTNLLYLLVHRPLFIAGFSMALFPILVSAPCRPLRDLLAHPFWAAPSRLTYGALLSHGIWMQFRDFNTERGTWACGLDAFLFFLAFAAFSFLFSLVTALVWEMPIAALWREFVVKPRELGIQEEKRVREAITVRNKQRRASHEEEDMQGKVGASLS
jgi:peptidoglycan/LPS O-acetylase OafA/YrhL